MRRRSPLPATATGGARQASLEPAGRAATLMAVGTALSRATGLARTAALAAALGVTALADAYNTANTVPNMLFMLVTGGTLSAVVLPMLAREHDPDRRREQAAVLGGAIVALTATAAILLLAAAPLLARGFALARAGQPDSASFVAVTGAWMALFAPQVLLYGLSVHAVAVLNAHGRLALAGFAPVATNLITVLAVAAYLWAGGPRPPSPAGVHTAPLVVLGAGTTLGVAGMVLIQWLGARRVLPGLRLRFTRRHPAVAELWRLGRWTLGYVVVNQLGLAVVLILANAVEGGVAAYQWAFAIMQLPYAVVAVSLLSALYPRLARTAHDPVEFGEQVATGLRLTAVVLLPAGVGLAILAGPVATLLLGYGAAAGPGAAFVAVALRFFGLALLPFTVFQLLTRAFYARSDTRTPMLANVAVNVVNVAGGLLAFGLLERPQARIAGLVAAWGASYVTGVVALSWVLAGHVRAAFTSSARALATAVLASAMMAAVLLGTAAAWAPPKGLVPTSLRTVALVAIGLSVYLVAALRLGSREFALLRARLRR